MQILVNSGVPYYLTEHYYFKQFIQCLQMNYHLPSYYMLTYILLPDKHAAVIVQNNEVVSTMKCITISIDGWEDRQRQSVYAFTVTCSQLCVPYILDIIELS